MRTDYIQPQGAPYAWNVQNDEALSEAVKSFFRKETTPEQIVLLRQYVTYYIDAPGWRDEDGQVLTALRERAAKIDTGGKLREWLRDALLLGIDPF